MSQQARILQAASAVDARSEPESFYHSATPLIILKASGFLTEDQVVEQVAEIYENLLLHEDEDQHLTLTHDDLMWFSELRYWERLWPEEEKNFPGIRPQPRHRLRFGRGYVPACDVCKSLDLTDEQCPFIRFLPCPRGVHENYKQRLGIEWDGCPACWEEDLAAVRQVEEQAEMANLVMDGRTNKRRKIR